MTDTAVGVIQHPPPASGHHRWRRIAVATVALAALGAIGACVWWLTHPTWFPDFGGDQGAVATVGRPLWAGLTFPNVAIDPVTLHLDTVTAHAVSDTSAATITPYVCTNRPQSGPGITAVGIGGTAMMHHLCARVVPAHGVAMTTGRGHPEYLVLNILPAHAGRLRLDRVDVSYRKGLQRGDQWIDFDLTVAVRPAR